MPLNRERVLELLEVFKASSAGELAVQEGEAYYRFARAAAPAEAAPFPAEAAAAEAEAAPPTVEPAIVTARVVGLFYRGQQPGQDPLVEVGDEVREGQTLGVIEVLRKPTIIVSPVNGTVTQITHEDGEGVQYGDPLFAITPQ